MVPSERILISLDQDWSDPADDNMIRILLDKTKTLQLG